MKSLGSLNWWLGVVLVGIILNILSSYLKPILDSAFSRASSWWLGRSERERDNRARVVIELRNDEHKQVLMLAEETRKRLQGIVNLLISLVMLLLYVSVKISFSVSVTLGSTPPSFVFMEFILWASLLFMFFGLIDLAAAMKCKFLVAEAQDN